ncbi:MAG: hypothetical protein ABI903_13330 [Actinomycetota bacterium]
MSVVGTQVRGVVAAATRLRAVWAALLALTALASLVSVLTSPLSAQEGEFMHALRAGEISSVAVGHSADFRSYTGFSPNAFNSTDDIAVSWVNRFGFRRAAVLTDLMTLDKLRNAGGGVYSTSQSVKLDPSGSVAATARALGAAAPAMVRPGELPLDSITWLPVVVIALMIGIMLFGPQPRRLTKWGALWAYTAPLNIGILYELLRDSPWNQKMNLLPEPGRRDRVTVNPVTGRRIRRLGGWSMFIGVWVFAAVLVSLVPFVTGWALPDFVDPVRWTGVDLSGKPLQL